MHESKSRLDSVSREVAPQRSVGRPRQRGRPRPADRPPALALTGSLNAARSLWPHLAASSHCNNSRRQKWVNAFALLASPSPALFPSSNEFLAFALARPLKISSPGRTSFRESDSLYSTPVQVIDDCCEAWHYLICCLWRWWWKKFISVLDGLMWSHSTLSVLAGVMLSGCIWVNLDFLTSAVRSAVSCSGILYSGHGRMNTA